MTLAGIALHSALELRGRLDDLDAGSTLLASAIPHKHGPAFEPSANTRCDSALQTVRNNWREEIFKNIPEGARSLPLWREVVSEMSLGQTTQLLRLPKGSINFDEEEESLSLEWILKDRRLGFVFNRNSVDSSWFMVLQSGRCSESGSMESSHASELLRALVENSLPTA